MKPKPEVTFVPITMGDMEQVILGAEGIFTALRWIDYGLLDRPINILDIEAARANLIEAGIALCDSASSRF